MIIDNVSPIRQVVVLAIVAAVAEGAPQFFAADTVPFGSFRNSLLSSPSLSAFGTPRVSSLSIAPRTFGLNSAVNTINSAIGTINSAVPAVRTSFQPLSAAEWNVNARVNAVPAGVSATACPNYPFCTNLVATIKAARTDCKQIKDIEYVRESETECEEVTDHKICKTITVYKKMCSEETQELCEQKQDEEGNFYDTDDCEELEKTVCEEVPEEEEECEDVKKNECNVVTKKVPKQITRTVCPEDPDFQNYQEDEEEEGTEM